MLRLRPYKACDAQFIVKWIRDEVEFRKWCADRKVEKITFGVNGENWKCLELELER